MQLNKQTYEEFFLMFIDDELNEMEKKQVQDFIQQHPELEQEFRALQQSVVTPETEIQFDNKELLYRKEDDRRIPVMWGRWAAAAIVILSLGIAGWLFLSERPFSGNSIVATTPFSEIPREATAPEHPPALHPSENESQAAVGPEPIKEPSSEIKPRKEPGPFKTVQQDPVEQNIQPITDLQKPRILPSADNPDPAEQLVADEHLTGIPVEQQKTPVPEYADLEVSTASTINNKTKITIDVDPKKLENEINTIAVDEEPEIYYANASDNDMIYFANTAIPKKNSLRGIFRKASRIIDKVTSFQ